MPADYEILAPIYEQIGMAQFATVMTPRIVEYAYSNDWIGRRVIDLGCGTGASLRALDSRGFSMTGVDQSAEMLAIARSDPQFARNYRWEHQDIRQLENLDQVDLVLALDVLNELSSLNDLGATFKGVHQFLMAGRWFIFDMLTLEGIIERGRTGDSIEYDDGETLSVFGSNRYDYERQVLTRDYLVYRKLEEHWERSSGQRVLRGFPVQAVTALLHRNGFSVFAVLTLGFHAYEPGATSAERVIYVAVKQ